jgi:hypothetical protein
VEHLLTPVIGASRSTSPCALHKFLWRRRCSMRLTLAQHIVTSLRLHITDTTLSHRVQTPPYEPPPIWLLATAGLNIETPWTSSHSQPQSMRRPACVFDTTTSHDTPPSFNLALIIHYHEHHKQLPRMASLLLQGLHLTHSIKSMTDVDVPQRLPPRLQLNRV